MGGGVWESELDSGAAQKKGKVAQRKGRRIGEGIGSGSDDYGVDEELEFCFPDFKFLLYKNAI